MVLGRGILYGIKYGILYGIKYGILYGIKYGILYGVMGYCMVLWDIVWCYGILY